MLLFMTLLGFAPMSLHWEFPWSRQSVVAALQDEPEGSGPRGTSRKPGQEGRYDSVGYASWYGQEMGPARTASGRPFDPNAMIAAHRTLPLGSFAEVTSLTTGKTILVMIDDRGPMAADREIDLSRGAADALGITRSGISAVRVRRIDPPASDQIALRSGRPAADRLDTPPILLKALMKQLPPPPRMASVTRPIAKSQPGVSYALQTPPPALEPGQGVPSIAAGFTVQVAAFGNAARAQSLADSLGGWVQAAGSVFRVRVGPFADLGQANRARDDLAGRGYGDARVVRDER